MRQRTFRTRGLLAALAAAGVLPLWSAGYGELPLTFEANRGQADAQFLYLARGQGYGLFLSRSSATLRLISQSSIADLRMSVSGAAANPTIEGIGPLAGVTHYYRGQDPRQWITDVPTFARVRYASVYPGVDLVFYGNQRSLEYDFVVAPGANPHAIALAFEGASRIQIDPSGDLLLNVPGGQVRFLKPVAYQEIAGVRRPVTARYRLNGGRVSFALGAYDSNRPLIVDPTLNYSSYLGGSGLDGAAAIAMDASGDAYIAGYTASANFPTSAARQPGLAGWKDAFVAKIDPLGKTLLFSTFLGGSAGNIARGIAVDGSGNAYVVGSTYSADFPTLNPLQSYGGNGDAFISKLTSSGTLVYSTYLGGSATDGARAVAVDAPGNAYVAGVTASSNFPVTAGAYQTALGGESDAFVVKLNAAGSAATYSTYLGGSGTDEANAIAVDISGDAWVAGSTWSSTFPTMNPLQGYGGSQDGFVTKLNPTGTGLLFSTFLGGSSLDVVNAIALDGNGDAYVAGSTGSVDFPVTTEVVQPAPGGFFANEDAFVAKYNSTGTQVVYSTYLGGSSADIAYAIAVDAQGYAYVAGETASSDFPVLNSLQGYAGGTDAFVTVVNASGTALVFSTFLGGTGDDSARGIAVDANGRIYVAGGTSSTNFPISPASGALQANAGGGIEDAFVAAMQFCSYSLSVNGAPLSADGGTGSLVITAAAGCPWSVASSVPWITLQTPISGFGDGTVDFTVAPNTSLQTLTGALTAGWQSAHVFEQPSPLSFIPMTPCRVVDTRYANGAFGSPSLVGGATRDFTIPNSSCDIPANAAAWSLNVTVVPPPDGVLEWLTVWPSGQTQPYVSTLNSLDGRIKANSAIIPSGTGGAVSVYATNTTDLVLDIDGYFVPAASDASALAFYPLTPCRVADTRYASFGALLGPPSLSAGQPRDFPVLSSTCNVPASAQAYSLNFTGVPPAPFDYITTYPTGKTMPLASTLNDLTGTIVANAGIVPAGSGGSVSVYSSGATDLVIDINGYFAPPGTGGLSLYNLMPCRVLDTRQPAGSPPFSGQQAVNVAGSGCGAPAAAQAYVFNATVVPPGPLTWLTLWPQGGTMPVVSTLNALDGAITSNMAIVPTSNGSISAYMSVPNTSYLVLDIFGYFAP
jgi:hypothetical protein